MRRALLRLLIAVAGVLSVALMAHAASDQEDSLAALREEAARHPDDPDYSWAVAGALEATGRPLQAAARMREHLARWPDHPRDGWRALGRCEYRAGHFESARDALEEAVRRDARDAEAELYLGLALQSLGDDEAERHLEAAADLDPALAGDALLLAGISHLSRGDSGRGRELLERVIEVAPDSDSARQARALADRSRPARSAISIEASTGALYDSNVTLGGEGDLPGADDAEGDAEIDFTTQLAWRPPIGSGERQPFELTTAYERFDYLDHQEFSGQRALGGGAWTQPLGERFALRMYGGGSYYLLDNDPYLLSGIAQPSLFAGLGGRLGVVRLYGVGEYLDYDEDPIFVSLERSGWQYGGGAEHVLSFGGGERRRGWFAWGGSFSRRDTTARRDDAGYGGAYDSDRWRASTRALVQLPFDVSARGDLYFDAEMFQHRNVIDALTNLENGSTAPGSKRRDYSIGSSLSLRRPLFGGVDLELLGSFEDHDSNVSLYTYRRATAGLRLHAAFP